MQETPTDKPAPAAEAPADGSLPLLIYDGDCGFCVYWARYWQKLTGERVDYRPYQRVAAQYPEITEAEFQRAVQYIAPDGQRASAAEASFLTLSHAPGKAFWLALYRHAPGFAPLSELAYAFIAAHRSAFYRISLLLWGRNYEPPRYELVSYLFLRGLGLVYLAAFVSFAVQAQGLIGSDGILPLTKSTEAVAARFGAERYFLAPMVFWLNDSDAAIRGVCWAGAPAVASARRHFLTQPLPTALAWHAAQMPAGLLAFATGAMFFVELVLPFFIFAPRRLRFIAAFGFLLLEFCILITGNYNWFNLQTMLLCLPLFDDAALRRMLPSRLAELKPKPPTPKPAVRIAVSAIAVLIVFCSLVRMDLRFGGTPPAFARTVDGWIRPLNVVSGYGLFAIMTVNRHEIVMEGSYDGKDWYEYEFRYKPGDVTRAPPWNIPHQPRLDSQMWFAALDNPQRLRWFWNFLERLLENEPTVTALLQHNPFADSPPTYVRALFYDYTFAGSDKTEGQWWNRRLLGQYFPPAHLRVRPSQ